MAEIPPFFLPAGPVGVLLIHGLTASPTEMYPLGQFLHQQGFTALGVRLAGHGTTPHDLTRTRWQDWYASVETGLEELERHCRQIFVAGLSAGSILSVLLAVRHPSRISGVNLLCPAFYLRPRQRRLLPLARVLRFFRREIAKGVHSIAYLQNHQLFSYSTFPLPALVEFHRLTIVGRHQLPNLRRPTQIFVGAKDQTVDPASGISIFNQISCSYKSLSLPLQSDHILTVEPDAATIFASIAAFIRFAS